MWQTRASRAFTQRLGLQHPIVLAPMAGVSTPRLIAAVSNEGGLGLFGAAGIPLADLPGVLQDIKSLLRPGKPFGVNLFVPPAEIPPHTEQQQQALEAVHAYYASTAAKHNLACKPEMLPTPAVTELHAAFEAAVQVLLDEQVPVMSFYFGLPQQQLLSRIQDAGVFTIGTATCLPEAQQMEAAGVDCIVVQGYEAGGHRGTWYTTGDYQQHMTGTTTLVTLLAHHIKHTPLLAAGGIMTGQQVVAALAAGAAGVQLGTAFLTCPEAATLPPAKQLLLHEPDRGTTVTQAFTGRPARGVVSQVTRDLQQLQEQLPLSLIGLVNARPFFAAAAAAGQKELMMQLCGQGYPLCRDCSAQQVIHQLLQEADATLEQLTQPGGSSG